MSVVESTPRLRWNTCPRPKNPQRKRVNKLRRLGRTGILEERWHGSTDATNWGMSFLRRVLQDGQYYRCPRYHNPATWKSGRIGFITATNGYLSSLVYFSPCSSIHSLASSLPQSSISIAFDGCFDGRTIYQNKKQLTGARTTI